MTRDWNHSSVDWDASRLTGGFVMMNIPAKGTAKKTRRTKRAGRGKAYRDSVWNASDGTCADCSRRVIRTLDIDSPNAGHVHHLRGRNVAPEDRWNPQTALLLCRTCHLARHNQR